MKRKIDLMRCVVVLLWREFKASRFPHSVNTELCRPAFLSGFGLPGMMIFIMEDRIKGECSNTIKHAYASYLLKASQFDLSWPLFSGMFIFHSFILFLSVFFQYWCTRLLVVLKPFLHMLLRWVLVDWIIDRGRTLSFIYD